MGTRARRGVVCGVASVWNVHGPGGLVNILMLIGDWCLIRCCLSDRVTLEIDSVVVTRLTISRPIEEFMLEKINVYLICSNLVEYESCGNRLDVCQNTMISIRARHEMRLWVSQQGGSASRLATLRPRQGGTKGNNHSSSPLMDNNHLQRRGVGVGVANIACTPKKSIKKQFPI